MNYVTYVGSVAREYDCDRVCIIMTNLASRGVGARALVRYESGITVGLYLSEETVDHARRSNLCRSEGRHVSAQDSSNPGTLRGKERVRQPQ